MQVIFERNGQGVGSKSWGYTAYYGSLERRSMSAKLVNGLFVVRGTRGQVVDVPSQDPETIDTMIRGIVSQHAAILANRYKTTVRRYMPE